MKTDKNSNSLTPGQERIYETIKTHVKVHGYPPTVREIGKKLVLTVATVHGHITALEKKGYLKREARKPRAIQVLDVGVRGVKGHAGFNKEVSRFAENGSEVSDHSE